MPSLRAERLAPKEPRTRARNPALPTEGELVQQLRLFLVQLLELLLMPLGAAPGDQLLVLQRSRFQGRPLARILLLVVLELFVILRPAQVLHAPEEADAVQLGDAL